METPTCDQLFVGWFQIETIAHLTDCVCMRRSQLFGGGNSTLPAVPLEVGSCQCRKLHVMLQGSEMLHSSRGRCHEQMQVSFLLQTQVEFNLHFWICRGHRFRHADRHGARTPNRTGCVNICCHAEEEYPGGRSLGSAY